MKNFLLTLVALTLTATFASQAFAGPKSGGSKNAKKPAPSKVTQNTKNVTPAKSSINKGTTGTSQNKVGKSAGISYKGKNQNHWTMIRWDARYGCNCYWDPYVLAWYYWCEQDDCYYPVTYCPYRTYCDCGVVAVACETCRPATCDTCATVLPDAVQSTAPPISNIPAIPEPVVPRQ